MINIDPEKLLEQVVSQFYQSLQDIEASKQEAKLGTRTFLDHCVQQFHLNQRMLEGLKELGIIPDSFAENHAEQYIFSSDAKFHDGVYVGGRLAASVADLEKEIRKKILKELNP